MTDTIFAASSGTPPAAIAIVRMSGPSARAAAMALAGRPLPPDRSARLRVLRSPEDGHILDRAIVLVFGGPGTATGEDIVEFHIHGGRAVVAAILSALSSLPNLRRADPGEFTRRALANGIIDLTEAEGLGDLLAAETEGQRRAAMRMSEGGLRVLIENWTTRLIEVAAAIEAQLDFSDEDDVPPVTSDEIGRRLGKLVAEIAVVLDQPPIERLTDGIRVVLAGPPNSGKSTLLNAMAGRDVAIVSPVAGTTRDRIEAPVIRGGIAYVLTDTAGLRDDSVDPIERIGIERARGAVAAADLVVWLGDDAPAGAALWLHARADMIGREAAPPGCCLAVAAGLPADVARLWDVIVARTSTLLPYDALVTINRRQRELIECCAGDLRSCEDEDDLLIIAEHLRRALHTLDRIGGRAGIEDVLDTLFARFCIGK